MRPGACGDELAPVNDFSSHLRNWILEGLLNLTLLPAPWVWVWGCVGGFDWVEVLCVCVCLCGRGVRGRRQGEEEVEEGEGVLVVCTYNVYNFWIMRSPTVRNPRAIRRPRCGV